MWNSNLALDKILQALKEYKQKLEEEKLKIQLLEKLYVEKTQDKSTS